MINICAKMLGFFFFPTKCVFFASCYYMKYKYKGKKWPMYGAKPLPSITVPYKYVCDSSLAKCIPNLDGPWQFCGMLVHCELVQLAR